MIRFSTILAIMLWLFTSCEREAVEACGLERNTEETKITNNVLFIGNSLTHSNDIPGILRKIAKTMGDSMYWEASYPGGCTFQVHCRLPATLSAIQSKNWDVVVLQESSYRASAPLEEAEQRFYPYADTLTQIIRNYHPDAIVLLYHVPAYKNGSDRCVHDQSACSYEGMQNKVNYNYMQAADIVNLPIAPAGFVWQYLFKHYPELDLFASDGIHQNAAGSYLCACVLYATIFKKAPEDIYIHPGVLTEEAELLQRTTTNMIFDCSPSWKDYAKNHQY